MEEQAWHPGTLLKLSGSYWSAFVLHASVKLGLYDPLAAQPLTAGQLAERIGGARSDALLRLLNVLCAMKLLIRSGDRFDLSDAARRFLVRNSEDYIGYIIQHHHYLADSWQRLDQAVLSGEPQRSRASLDSEKRREAFLMGMFNLAMLQAPAIVETIDLGDRTRLLDLGGGPGTYAINFCLKYPDLSAVVFDLPATRPFAEKTIDRFGLSDRIQFNAGDYHADKLQGQFDAVWLSHILHADGPEACRTILDKAVRALVPGGRIFIHEFILSDTMDEPLFPTLFSLNMMLGTEAGQSYSEGQLRRMLEAAGIRDVKREPYTGPTDSGILSGVR